MTSIVFYAVWYALSAILLLFIPAIIDRVPLWRFENTHAAFLVAWTSGFIIAATYILINVYRQRIRFLESLAVFLAVHGLMLLVITIGQQHSLRFATLASSAMLQTSLLVTFTLGSLLVVAPILLSRQKTAALGTLGIALMGAVAANLQMSLNPGSFKDVDARIVNTSLYNLRLREFRGFLDKSEVRGGGIAIFGENYLLVNGDGVMYRFNFGPDNTFFADRLPYRVPANAKAFREDAGDNVQLWRFRIADVLVQESDAFIRVFASHHYWHSSRNCFVVRVSAIQGSEQQFRLNDANLQWKTVFESQPCLKMDAKERGEAFAGHLVGGGMALIDDQSLLLSIGDHGYNGYNANATLAQDSETHYGKTILIDLETLSAEVFSLGHRNPQGLLVDSQQRVWLTEHGPRGGDELNLIYRNRNYGWPLVTYGTHDDAMIWPLSKLQGDHSNYELPMISWVPSIGISNLVETDSELFSLWQHDLLIASLNGYALYRTRIRENRVTVREPIRLSHRIRDLIFGHDGKLILYLEDAAAIASVTPIVGAMDGEILFAAKCSNCHSIGGGRDLNAAPDLRGIVGRPIASLVDYDYSDGLKAIESTWTRKRLADFLADPQNFAPGNSMVFSGISDSAERRLLLDYLDSLP